MIKVTLFSRQECTLCDRAIADLEALREEIPHELIVVDVDKDPALKAAYGERVPVIEVGPYTLDAPFDRRKLRMTALCSMLEVIMCLPLSALAIATPLIA